VLATPGHTPDHFSFFSPTAGVLFAGDALNTRDGRINLTPPRITADKTAARQSGIRLLELSPAVIACGHGTPSTKHTTDELMHIFDTLRQE
jgi:glyoxylase-like metal-dependent hydrolase (beta-lactamase superfamily II)